MRLFVSLSYNGHSYCGWQSQPSAPSVQAQLERALSIAFAEEISVVGAGRTDALVNASYYVAHFDTTCQSLPEHGALIRKINAILPSDISVFALYRVGDQAHARFDAISRTYKYFIHTSKDPFATYSCFYKFPVDLDAMNCAAESLLGTHDFSSFEKIGGGNATSICEVTEARWEAADPTHLVFTITANRFLRNMVRAIVGTLLEVGRGRYPVQWVEQVLQSHDRGQAGQSVAGQALFLSDIRYPYELKTI